MVELVCNRGTQEKHYVTYGTLETLAMRSRRLFLITTANSDFQDSRLETPGLAVTLGGQNSFTMLLPSRTHGGVIVYERSCAPEEAQQCGV